MPRGGAREGAGRKPGVQNVLNRQAKDVIAQVADSLGGVEGLLRWVKEDPANEKVFWGGMYTKLLPLQLTGEGGGPVQTQEVPIVVQGVPAQK